MRVLVISDVHSNLEALLEVLGDADGFDLAICAGDIVGYGPNPSECLRKIDELGFHSVMGNHDYAIVTGDTSGFNPYAAEAVRINRRLLEADEVRRLGSLPMGLNLEIDGVRIQVYHGSPSDPVNEYVFPEEAEAVAEDYLEALDVGLIILGHTHIPYVIETGNGFLMNPGSVGQPRDGDPRASYMLLEIEGSSVKVDHRRVDYDVDSVASKMRRMGLPEVLAARLYGGW
ncbi:MAG: metallophosphoesterase family protein [Candidatus Bathyarchaeia archaeon]|nr:metallophosphoesterase family protein [Candidatus Bathyarchaeota archaeon]